MRNQETNEKIKKNELIVLIDPVKRNSNVYALNFSSSLGKIDRTFVKQLNWDDFFVPRQCVIVLHWPQKLFYPFSFRQIQTYFVILKSYSFVFFVRFFRSARLVWVAHNVKNHDAPRNRKFIEFLFFRSLDGIIFLSFSSKRIINEVYPVTESIKSLITRHGSYRWSAMQHERPMHVATARPRLLFFGQVLPYKGLEILIDAAGAAGHSCELNIVGKYRHSSYAASLKRRAERFVNIRLDLRDEQIEESELEGIIDNSDGVVLPYTSILNSGSAILSLSRNRPILVPRLGSLTELHEDFGIDWVHHYDAALSAADIERFVANLTRPGRPNSVEMDRYDWSLIAHEIRGFLAEL